MAVFNPPISISNESIQHPGLIYIISFRTQNKYNYHNSKANNIQLSEDYQNDVSRLVLQNYRAW
jgi:hypothetical protein